MANRVFTVPDYQDDRFSLKEIKSIHRLQGKFKKHFHEDYSIAIVARGSTIAWFDGVEYRIEEGDVVLIPQCVVHACNPQTQENWSYWLITVKPSWLASAFKDTPWIDNLFAGPCIVTKATPAARQCFAKLTSIPLLADTASEIENLLIELITSIIDAVECGGEQHSQPVESPSIEYAASYLWEHYEHDVSLDKLSHITGLSKYHLVRSFVSCYSLTPHAYLINVRINTARELLRKGSTIVETAMKSGFYDQSHFTRTFRRYVGMTPSAYKRSV